MLRSCQGDTLGWFLLSSKTISEDTFLPALRKILKMNRSAAIGLKFRAILLPNGKRPQSDKDHPPPAALHLEIDDFTLEDTKKISPNYFGQGAELRSMD
jgi:hypothetical protein